MRKKKRKPNLETKKRVKDALLENKNVAAAINISAGNASRSVSSRQRIVQEEGKTTKITEVTRDESR